MSSEHRQAPEPTPKRSARLRAMLLADRLGVRIGIEPSRNHSEAVVRAAEAGLAVVALAEQ